MNIIDRMFSNSLNAEIIYQRDVDSIYVYTIIYYHNIPSLQTQRITSN